MDYNIALPHEISPLQIKRITMRSLIHPNGRSDFHFVLQSSREVFIGYKPSNSTTNAVEFEKVNENNILRRKLVGATCERIFFVEELGSGSAVIQLSSDFDPKTKQYGKLTRKIALKSQNQRIIAIEDDFETYQYDLYRKKIVVPATYNRMVYQEETEIEILADNKNVLYRIYVMDESRQVTLYEDAGVGFHAKRVIETNQHAIYEEFTALKKAHWFPMSISERALTIGGTYFSTDSDISGNLHLYNNAGESINDLDFRWSYMMPKAPLQISLVLNKRNRKFKVTVQPQPGNKQRTILGSQRLEAIDNMCFVQNETILVELMATKNKRR